MSGNRSGRKIDKTAFDLSRILIASYFIAQACGFVDAGRDQALALLPHQDLAVRLDAGFVFATAFMLLVGYRTRIVALMLGLYIFWTSFVTNFAFDSSADIALFWRDLSLIGGLLMTSIYSRHFETRPRRRRRRLFTAAPRPRRVVPRASAATRRPGAADGHAGATVLRMPIDLLAKGPAQGPAENLFTPDGFGRRTAMEGGLK